MRTVNIDMETLRLANIFPDISAEKVGKREIT
jgi:hypothetical protein